METYQLVEALKALIIEKGLPRTEVALFGLRCPYCGKSDRIHRLEGPEGLPEDIDAKSASRYSALWQRLNPSTSRIGVCKFCLNPLELFLRQGKAKALDSQ